MSLLAGAFRRSADACLSNALCESVARALSRNPDEQLDSFRDGRCFLVKADVGAFGERAFHRDAAGVSIMAGEPLLRRPEAAPRSRSADLAELHMAFQLRDWEPLRRARGVFCAASYRTDDGSLLLTTDKLGIRPMFYWANEHLVVFATALRILEQVQGIERMMDARAVTELAAFGFPLADRTPYAATTLLMPGEVIEFTSGEPQRQAYWRWDDVQPSGSTTDDLAATAYNRFQDAVTIRARSDRRTIAYLSGGLDSRAVVTSLRERGMAVHTFNFGMAGTQDQVFGADYARQIGTKHTEVATAPGQPEWSMLMAEAWRRSGYEETAGVERPQIVWSGDGGSVVLGHVYLEQRMVQLARAGQVSALVELLNQKWGAEVSSRLFRPEVYESLRGVTRHGLMQGLSAIASSDPGRSLHLFLLYNDQRRHLSHHFETLDLHRLEFELPFFDSEFVTSVLSVPVDVCLRHTFYMRWLREFPAVIASVPWQAYPGHEPCPLPVPDRLEYQWNRERARSVATVHRRDLVARTARMLAASEFPDDVINRKFLRLASWLHRLEWRDFGYLIRTAEQYYRYWSASSGRVAWPKE